MKLNLNSIKKTEQVIFKAMQEIPKDNVGFTKLVNTITNNETYFLIYNATPYADIEFISRKLAMTKEQIFYLVNEDNILVDSYTYRQGIHYYLSIEDVLLLVKESNVKDKQKHVIGMQYVFNKALEKHKKYIEFNIACKKLKLKD